MNLLNLYVGPPFLTVTQALVGVMAILGGSAGLARVPRVASALVPGHLPVSLPGSR